MTDWLRWPEHCAATITVGPRRDRRQNPCGRVAVAVAWHDGMEDGYPVCKHHARGREMLSLADIIDITRGEE